MPKLADLIASDAMSRLCDAMSRPTTEASRRSMAGLARAVQESLRLAGEIRGSNRTGWPNLMHVLAMQYGYSPKQVEGLTIAQLVMLLREAKHDNDRSATGGPATAVDDAVLASPATLANLFGVPTEALRKRLSRWRDANPGSDGWVENPEPGLREPRYLYRVGEVRPIIAASQASGKRPAKKK